MFNVKCGYHSQRDKHLSIKYKLSHKTKKEKKTSLISIFLVLANLILV